MSKDNKVGLIGAGLMGHGIGKNIVEKGYPLAVLGHRNRKPVDDLLTRGATEAKTPRELAAGCDLVITCVTASPQMEEIVFGENGLLSGMHPGVIVADATTADPNSTLRIAAAIEAKGGRFVDIPLTRTPKEAEAGKLGIMTGGDAATLAEIRPVLECFADAIIHVGGVGAGHKVKLINNFIGLGTAAVVCEALCAAAKAEVDLAALIEVVSAGGANSLMFQRLSQKVLKDDDSSFQFAIGNAQKDLRYYTGMTEMLPSTSFIAEAVHQTMIIAANAGLKDAFVPRLLDVLGEINGVTVRAPQK
jgi:3-hydroxyisobutyrate dehydrogenase-like beta-hydroxyacid dehydrogenase